MTGYEATFLVAFVFLRSIILQPVSSNFLNTIVYIDGLNLHYSLDNTPYKWLNVQVLVENILTSSLHKIIQIKYFTAIPTKADSARKHHLYLQALKTLQNIEIIYGKHKKTALKFDTQQNYNTKKSNQKIYQ